MNRDRLILVIGIIAVLAAGGAAVVYLSDWKKRAQAAVGDDQYNYLAGLFSAAEQANGIPTDLLARQGYEESRWDVNAVGAAGEQGIMQFMPGTAAQVGLSNPFDPAQAIPAAASFLAGFYRTYGKWSTALAAYNEGPGNVAKGVIAASTQAYIKDILGDVNAEGGAQLA